jgi:hypothetical protein
MSSELAAKKKMHQGRFMLLHTFLKEREQEENEYRERVKSMCDDPEIGKQYQAFLSILMIDSLVLKTLLMITDDYERMLSLHVNGLETCLKQIEREIDGLLQIVEYAPDEKDALAEARDFEKVLKQLYETKSREPIPVLPNQVEETPHEAT